MNLNLKLIDTRDKKRWIKFIESKRVKGISRGGQLTIDLTSIRFIYPFQLVSLACLIEEYYKQGWEIEFSNCDSTDVCEYLDSISFFRYWERNFDRNLFRALNKQTAFCLWQLDSSRIHSYLEAAKSFFERNHFEGRSVEPLIICLMETFNNIIDHSESCVFGYTISQFFPKNHIIRMSICDLGIGISQSVNNFRKLNNDPVIPDDDALMAAFQQGFTTKSSQHNKGFGLDNLKSAILSTGGSLEVLTNQAFMKIENNTHRTNCSQWTFNGTLIDVVLDTTQLDVKDLDYSPEDLYF